MSEESMLVLRGKKIAHIIECISSMYGISLKEATNIYYKSETAGLIDDGVADLHCRSDKYLATLVWEEAQESHIGKIV